MIRLTETQSIIVAAVLVAALLLVLVIAVKSIYKCFHLPYTEAEDYPNISYTQAQVVSKWNYMEKQGTKTASHHRIVYMAEFLTQTGETVKYEIPQEVYLRLEQNQKGTLAVCEDKFFGFEQ